MKNRFFNLYSHDFARVAVGVPRCRVADPAFNAAETIDLAKQAAANGAVLVAFPELGLPAYTCDDLFHQRALLDACEEAVIDKGRKLQGAVLGEAVARRVEAAEKKGRRSAFVTADARKKTAGRRTAN